MEFLAASLPRIGGAVVQAEDEIAAIGMVLGASYAGQKAMTATSGPGLSLMTEMLGLASMAEIPAVIVDCQRAGPSTGMPTRHEQGDLSLAVFGAHGEVQRAVLAPTSVMDCFEVTPAFNPPESSSCRRLSCRTPSWRCAPKVLSPAPDVNPAPEIVNQNAAS